MAAVVIAALAGEPAARGEAEPRPAVDTLAPGRAQVAGAGLRLIGRHDLGAGGLNGQVAVVGTTAVVGAGIVNDTGDHTDRFTPYPCFTATVRVVDLSDPTTPRLAATIPIGRGVAAIDVAALRVATPSFTGDLAAIALDDGPSHEGPSSCSPSSATNERGVAYYDVTDPDQPRFLGRYQADAEDVVPQAPACGPTSSARCATGQHSVALVQRGDGRVLSLSSEPLASHPVRNRPAGDLRIVDVTDPSRPVQVGDWPPLGGRPSPFSSNGCRRFSNNHDSQPSRDGMTALVAYMDDGLLTFDIGDPSSPVQLGRWDYPTDRTVEGNAAYVAPAQVGGRSIALVGEEDWVAPETRLRIDAPASLAGERFACEANFTLFDPEDTAQIYRKPGSQIAGELVYVGRGCGPRGTAAAPIAADPLLADPAGRIALVDAARMEAYQPTINATGCGFALQAQAMQNAGAVAAVRIHRNVPPFQASPYGISGGGLPVNTLRGLPAAGLSIPQVTIDEAEGDALRAALCPSVVGGACTGGPTATGALVDQPGEWGGVRVVDTSDRTAPTSLATFRTELATAFPPPDLGVYAPSHSVVRGTRAYVAWQSAGLRVLDLGPATPAEIGSFVPEDTPDPSGMGLPAKAFVVGVAAMPGGVVISDLHSGLYVLETPANGYFSAAADGGVFAFGDVDVLGSAAELGLKSPVVGITATPTRQGYWLVAADGGVFSFGDAQFFGSAGNLRLNSPVVGMTPTPTGLGYWLVAADGGIFTFGDAQFLGSTGDLVLNAPVVGMEATPSGRGYWLVAADGGIFAFGDAAFHGSTGDIPLNRPVVGMAGSATGRGYWLVASDGGVFTFGDARFLGSTGDIRLNSPVVGMAPTPGGRGYWLVAADGGIFTFGDAVFQGSTGDVRLRAPVTGMTAFPR